MKSTRKKAIWQYIIGIIIPLAVGGLSSFITRDNMNLTDRVKMPPLSPPSAVFGIVWPILFILMGISSTLIYRELQSSGAKDKTALWLYIAQLAVNFAWSIAFFNMEAYLFSFLWIILLEVLIIWMIYEFFKINPLAGALMIPYALWVAFAGYLNLGVYLLNR